MAFTYDLTTTTGKIRLTIGDTASGAYVFEDAEIAYFYTEGGTVDKASVRALQVMLTTKSYRVKRANVQGVAFDDTAQIAGLQAAIAELQLRIGEGAGLPEIKVTDSGAMPWEAEYFRAGGL